MRVRSDSDFDVPHRRRNEARGAAKRAAVMWMTHPAYACVRRMRVRLAVRS